MKVALCAVSVALVAGTTFGGLVETQTDNDGLTTNVAIDGALGAGEYSALYTNGGGSGFGGTLGAGALGMDADATNLYLGFDPGGNLNDNAVIFLDTRPGGLTDDTTMNDTGDPGRNLSSNLTRDVADFFPIGADYSVVIGGFGIVVFELQPGVDPFHLPFVAFDGTFTGNDPNLVREIALPLASLGVSGDAIDFFVAYGSDTNFMSDESIPAQSFSGSGNPGFDNNGAGDVTWDNYNRFEIPTPGAISLAAIAGLAGIRRRR